MTPPRAIVVVPARDEEQRIASCVRALARQGHLHAVRPWVVVVDDGSSDGTRRAAAAALSEAGLRHEIVDGPGAGVGWARRVGMDRAVRWALRAGAGGDCLLVSTDADTVADPGWLDALLTHADAGAPVLAGDVRLRADEPVAPALVERRRRRAAVRLAAVREAEGPDAAHHHFAAANLALTVDAYERIGGLPVPRALEDEALLERVRAAGLPVARVAAAVVRTSPRTDSRAPRGLGVDGALELWRTTRRYHHGSFGLERLSALVGEARVSVVVLARDAEHTIGGVLARTVGPLTAAGVVHETLVVDHGSTDATVDVALGLGARVAAADALVPGAGPCRGRGDALWRALHEVTGDVVAVLDADTEDPRVAHLAGVLGPLLLDRDVHLVRGAHHRVGPEEDGVVPLHGEGRVTELVARPLLNLHWPLLAGFRQPLSGPFAARGSLLRALPVPTGHGADLALLVDALAAVGLQGLAECDLGPRRAPRRPLRELGTVAYAVACALERRVGRGTPIAGGLLLPWEDGTPHAVAVDERPPAGEAPQVGEAPQAAGGPTGGIGIVAGGPSPRTSRVRSSSASTWAPKRNAAEDSQSQNSRTTAPPRAP